MDNDGRPRVNVDLSHASGIERAASLGLATSNFANVFVSPHLYDVTHLLLDEKIHRGRAFILIQNPFQFQLSACKCP
jgi:hypothetical protein